MVLGFQGTHVTAERLLNVPQALSKPHPPILIGGTGEKKTLRFVAKYADACNLVNAPDIEHKLAVLRQHCENEGRDYNSITKTVANWLDIGPDGAKTDALLADLERLAGLGIDAVLGWLPGVPDLRLIERFATDVIPAVEKF